MLLEWSACVAAKLLPNSVLPVTGLALVVGLGASARAEDWAVSGTMTFYETGKVFPVDKGHLIWNGDGHSFFLSDKGDGGLLDKTATRYTEVCHIYPDQQKMTCNGTGVFTDGQGSEAAQTFSCVANSVPPTTCSGTSEWTGGNGKYAGIHGKVSFVAHPTVHWEDGSGSGYSIWGR